MSGETTTVLSPVEVLGLEVIAKQIEGGEVRDGNIEESPESDWSGGRA